MRQENYKNAKSRRSNEESISRTIVTVLLATDRSNKIKNKKRSLIRKWQLLMTFTKNSFGRLMETRASLE